MREKDLKENGLADMAYKVERDHEVQMARGDLYKVAKYGIKLHEMLKGVSEEQGLEGWVQAKITKAADYLGSVYHHLDYEMKFDQVSESKKANIKEEEATMTVTNADKNANSKAWQEYEKGNPKYKYDKDAVPDKPKTKTTDSKSYVDTLAHKLEEAKKKGLYHNVNKRKKAGTSRSADHPDAPSPQDWKDAAKTAKKESVEANCPKCGNPSWKTLDETEKKKGTHGKACWDGHRRGEGNSCHAVKPRKKKK